MNPREILDSLPLQNGHFCFESGHHGDTWLDLELLCFDPDRVACLAAELSNKLRRCKIDIVCGPLVEGSFVALMVASNLNARFVYTEPKPAPSATGLYPVKYPLPGALRNKVVGKRVAIVNDVVNAGSAIMGTFASLKESGAQPVIIGALLVLGSAASAFAASNALPLEALAYGESRLWLPDHCPLCAKGVALDRPCER